MKRHTSIDLMNYYFYDKVPSKYEIDLIEDFGEIIFSFILSLQTKDIDLV